MVDRITEKKAGLNFARLLVKVKIGAQLPKEIYFRNEKGVVIDQNIIYEWKSSVYGTYHKYGHTTDLCRKNKTIR